VATIDTIILQGHNFKNYAVYVKPSLTIPTYFEKIAETTNTDTDTVITFASTACAAVRIIATETIAVNDEKRLAEVKAALSVFSGTQLWLSDVSIETDRKSGNYRTSGGGLVSYFEYQKWGASFTLENVSLADKQALMTLSESNDPFILSLCDDHDPAEIREVVFNGPVSWILDRKSGLYTVAFSVLEI
jgi:hypothetical protein